MVGSRSAFDPEQAPCGKTVGGDCYRDNDGEGSSSMTFYTCGCRRTRHEYHDGTVTARRSGTDAGTRCSPTNTPNTRSDREDDERADRPKRNGAADNDRVP